MKNLCKVCYIEYTFLVRFLIKYRKKLYERRIVMKIVTVIDSFKGSLSSMEAGRAAAEGIHRVDPQAEVLVRPLADGGEGTVQALVEGMGGKLCQVTVTGPLGKPVNCEYGILEESKTAILEMSAAAGITLVPREQLDPMKATTYGVGEMIKDAILKGCRRFIVGIGGSATNDGGVGMLQALGYDFLDSQGQPVAWGAQGLRDLVKISDERVLPQLRECEFHIACDVTNPLCGEKGCSAVFGPQKGATPKMIGQMDEWMGNYAKITESVFPGVDSNTAGSGAAGGLGFAFLAFTPAVLESGIQIVLRELKLEQDIAKADLVITGEGRLDEQTAMGKAPIGVARLAKKYGKPVIGFGGSVTDGARACNQNGIDAYFPILRSIVTLEEAMDTKRAYRNLADTAEQVFRLFALLRCDL